MFDKGIKVVAINNGIVYSKGDVFISYGIHSTEKEYFAIKLGAGYKRQLAQVMNGENNTHRGWFAERLNGG